MRPRVRGEVSVDADSQYSGATEPSQTVLSERLAVTPRVPVSEFALEHNGSRFLRIETGRHKSVAISYAASVDCGVRVYAAGAVEATPVSALESTAIPYLFPSRYCQSDRLSRLAWDLFGGIENPHEKGGDDCRLDPRQRRVSPWQHGLDDVGVRYGHPA